MHIRPFAASFALFVALACSVCGSAFAALTDELAEVTRLHHAGQSVAALERADKYLTAQPRDAQMRFLKSVVLADIGRTAEAAGMLRQLSEEYPELAEPHNNLAAIYASAGDYSQARVELEESLRLNPTYATAQENLGDVHVMLASQAYSKAQRLDPSAPSLPRKLALIRELASTMGIAAAAPASSATR